LRQYRVKFTQNEIKRDGALNAKSTVTLEKEGDAASILDRIILKIRRQANIDLHPAITNTRRGGIQ